MACYIPRWYTRPKTVTHPGSNRARRALTSFMRRTPPTTTPRRHYYYYFMSAAVAVDSSHMTASSSASWSRFSPPSDSVSGHVTTVWFIVCRWPQSQEGDWARPHLFKLARRGPLPVRGHPLKTPIRGGCHKWTNVEWGRR